MLSLPGVQLCYWWACCCSLHTIATLQQLHSSSCQLHSYSWPGLVLGWCGRGGPRLAAPTIASLPSPADGWENSTFQSFYVLDHFSSFQPALTLFSHHPITKQPIIIFRIPLQTSLRKFRFQIKMLLKAKYSCQLFMYQANILSSPIINLKLYYSSEDLMLTVPSIAQPLASNI